MPDPVESCRELERLREENRLLREKLRESQAQCVQFRKDILLERLMKGKSPELESIQAELHTMGVHFSSRDYTLVAIEILTLPGDFPRDSSQVKRQMEQMAREHFQTDYECITAHMDSGLYCLLGNTPSHEYMVLPRVDASQTPPPGENLIQKFNRQVLALYDRISAELGVSVFIAISRPFPGVGGIMNAYRDSEEILNYHRQMCVDAPFLCYHDFEMAGIETSDSDTALLLESEYCRQVRAWDYSNARKTLYAILKNDTTHSLTSLYTAKLRISAKLNLLLIALARVRSESLSAVSLQLMEQIQQLNENITLQELRQLIDEVFDQIDEYVWRYHTSNAPKWITEVLSDIGAHFREAEFNVAQLSGRFQLNPAYLSREFKKCMGYSLFDYIQLQRLQTARSELASGHSVQAAASRSGFGDSRSMRRAFQKYLKANPSEYRM